MGGSHAGTRRAPLSESRKVMAGKDPMKRMTRVAMRLTALVICLAAGVAGLAGAAPPDTRPAPADKLDRTLRRRADGSSGTSRVIVVMKAGAEPTDGKRFGGVLRSRLDLVGGSVLDLPNSQLAALAARADVESIHDDRPVFAHLNRVAVTVGGRDVQANMGLDGAGIGVAVIDSGVTRWHDDLTDLTTSGRLRGRDGQRVAAFVDFVNGAPEAYDDNGHGTHVAGIIAGNGYDTGGLRAGMAPAAQLVSLKVLDADGQGTISSVIAAFQWAIMNRRAHNIRVINLSVGAAVTESFNSDPLTLAAKRAVDAGIVVVAAAGNFGRNDRGETQYGGITAPGNAPWVLTVGASNIAGTVERGDDTVAPYSSRGPSAVDFQAKPDLVAPGTGVVSLSDPASRLYSTRASNLVDGSVATSYKPYLTLSGTSMA